jgi:hypothetical protein
VREVEKKKRFIVGLKRGERTIALIHCKMGIERGNYNIRKDFQTNPISRVLSPPYPTRKLVPVYLDTHRLRINF